MDDEERSRVLTSLEDTLAREPDVEFAVAFGSQVTGDARDSSDIDVAVKFAERLAPRERFQRRCFLAGKLQQPEAPFVDVSDIEALPPDVAHDAVAGEFLCGDRDAFRTYRDDVSAAFEDQRDEIRTRQRAVIERIAEDGLHG